MSVSITTIQPQDALSSSRLTLNSNFAALKAGVDALQVLLDPTTLILQGVRSAIINDNAVPYSTSIFQVGKGSSLLGNVIMGTVGATTSVLIHGTSGVTIDQSSLNITLGNLSLASASSLGSFGGHLSISKELRLPGIANAFSGLVGITNSQTIAVADLKYLVIQNNSLVGGQTASLSAGTSGQVLEIFHQIGESAFPVLINASNFSGLTGSISLTLTADTLRCVYDGAAWYLLGYSPASFAVDGGLTSSSITFEVL